MIEGQYPYVERFANYISPWIDDVLKWGLDDGLDSWEAIEIPWYEGVLSGDVRLHLLHTVVNCEGFVTLVSQLAAEPPLGIEGIEEVLMSLSPFLCGPLTEIRYMAYQFGPLYMNIVTKFFKYRGGEDILQAHKSELSWQDNLPKMATVNMPKVSTLCKELGRKGSRASSTGAISGESLSGSKCDTTLGRAL